MHNPNMRVLFLNPPKPIPACLVRVGPSERVQVVDGAPIGDGDEGLAAIWGRGCHCGGFAEDCVFGFRDGGGLGEREWGDVQPYFSRLASASRHMLKK